MPSLREYLDSEATLVVPIGTGREGEEIALTLVYNPHRLSMRENTRAIEAARAEDYETMIDAGLKALIRWDLVGPLVDEHGVEVIADGQEIPVRPEYIRLLPTRIVLEVLLALARTQQVDPQTPRS